MKTTISITVDSRLMKLVRASGINVSGACETALKEAVDFTDSDAIATEIERLKEKLRALGEQIIHVDTYDSAIGRLRDLYSSRHRANPNTTRDQDLFWIRQIKHDWGLVDVSAEEILAELEK